MQVTVQYESQLRIAAGTDHDVVSLPGQPTLLEAIHAAAGARGEALRDRLITPAGDPQPGILLFVNDRPVPSDSASRCLLRDGDSILLYPPISGG